MQIRKNAQESCFATTKATTQADKYVGVGREVTITLKGNYYVTV